ncbi:MULTISPECIES: LysR family transcriptional regulator [Marinobacter]|jgi:DNA-binding transcriptional LysR family regulator|nr:MULTISPECIES: LysR family transcriptional regulator [Marinobacter]KXJ45994.1 MAG: LysR family transcriptional regulator [Marinobacter sp. Hex_13]MBS8232538.1 LysR family transcriptional regulator [Marinobacter salarius]HIO99701.1 LysR family transcriptional regulator [Marinobacter salarius]|tara:strand:- start:102 stop:1016 length:915 start_codon:yes stop_codon:yes gene_type:complete
MPQSSTNRLAAMEIFSTVVEQGSFSKAARVCRLTPSAASKAITRLEKRLGTKLIHRSTRQMQLTAEGRWFYERCRHILSDLEEAEQGASSSVEPTGHLRITASFPVGHGFLIPIVTKFLARYPGITLELSLTDQVVNLLAEHTDVAIRNGPLGNSNLVARKLGETRMVIVGAPEYLERRGVPVTLEELRTHNRLGFNFSRHTATWPLTFDGEQTELAPQGNLLVSDGETMRKMAMEGVGLARLTRFLVDEDIRQGRLVPVMEEHNPGDREEVHAVFLGQGRLMPGRVRVFLDFLYDNIRISPSD